MSLQMHLSQIWEMDFNVGQVQKDVNQCRVGPEGCQPTLGRFRRMSTNVGQVQKDVNQRGNITKDKQGKDKLWGMIGIHPDNDLMGVQI